MQQIAKDVVTELTIGKPDILATACPLCKKTLSNASDTKVMDISELVADAFINGQVVEPAVRSNKKKVPAIL